MKAQSVALLSVAGMLLTSVSVYSLTPPGGAPPALPDTAALGGVTQERVVERPGAGDPAHFTTPGVLEMEGRLGHARILENARGETFVMLEVRGSNAEKAKAAAPVNLAIVIDRSGSMRGTRLTNAQSAAITATDRLHDGDVVSVIAFDTRTQIVVPPVTIGPGVRERIAADIRGITLGGDTCISCGVEDGLAQLERTGGKVNKMILLSDGEATAGVRDVPTFRSIAQRAQSRGASITTIGVDVDYNEKILAALAQESNGRHYFVENDAALSRVFESEAETLTATLASGVTATIDLGPGVELERVFDRSFQRAGDSVVVPLGSFSSGEVKTVLMKVRIAPQKKGAAPVAEVKLSYRDLVRDSDGASSGQLAIESVGDATLVGELDPVVAGRAARSETATTLQQANDLFARGRFEEAKRKLDEQAANVRRAAASARARPAARAKDVDKDFAAQIEALGQANQGFATPHPGANAAPAPAKPQESRSAKGAVRKNQESAVDLLR